MFKENRSGDPHLFLHIVNPIQITGDTCPHFIMKYSSKPVDNGILLPKLFWLTVRKKCSSDQEKLLKFEAEGQEFAKVLKSLEQFIPTVKGQNNFW